MCRSTAFVGPQLCLTYCLHMSIPLQAVAPKPAAAEVDALHAEVVKLQQAGHELQDRMQAGAQLPRWVGLNLLQCLGCGLGRETR